MKLVPKDVKIYKEFKNGWSPTQKLNIEFSILGSQEIGSNFISFDMIFEAPQSELLRFYFQTLSSNAQKLPGIQPFYIAGMLHIKCDPI